MSRIIINADDFGLTPAITRETVSCIEHGCLTSLSIMACGEAFDEAMHALRGLMCAVGVGVHLTLDSVRPVSPPHQVPSLLGPEGMFHPRARLVSRLLTRRIALPEVEHEWNAQIARVVSAGADIDHLDGHGHIHVFPGLAQIAVRLAQRYGIAAIRNPRPRLWGGAENRRLAGSVILRLAAAHSRNHFHRSLRYPDYISGFSQGGCYTFEAFSRDVKAMREADVVEAVFHPGPREIDSPAMKSWGYSWHVDADTLRLPAIGPMLEAYGIQPIRFRDL